MNYLLHTKKYNSNCATNPYFEQINTRFGSEKTINTYLLSFFKTNKMLNYAIKNNSSHSFQKHIVP